MIRRFPNSIWDVASLLKTYATGGDYEAKAKVMQERREQHTRSSIKHLGVVLLIAIACVAGVLYWINSL